MRTITAEQIKDFKGRIIDVRNPNEFGGERLARAECVPLPMLPNETRQWDRAEPLLLMCKSGMRSKQAYDDLAAAGFSNLTMLAGGIEACKKAGIDVICIRKTIPIMRQVMIAAGLLLLIGLSLGLLQPAFYLIDWFVACGLLFAGITGVCFMARLLEMMPWNRTPSPLSCSSTTSSCCSTASEQQR